MSLELSDDARVTIELYLQYRLAEIEERRHKRIIQICGVVALFGALGTWLLSTATLESAKTEARNESNRFLKNDNQIKNMQEQIDAENKKIDKFRQDSAAANLILLQASVEANKELANIRQAAVGHIAEVEAQVSNLKTTLAESQKISDTLDKLKGTTDVVIKSMLNDSGFQKTITNNIAATHLGWTPIAQDLPGNPAFFDPNCVYRTKLNSPVSNDPERTKIVSSIYSGPSAGTMIYFYQIRPDQIAAFVGVGPVALFINYNEKHRLFTRNNADTDVLHQPLEKLCLPDLSASAL